MMKLLKDVTSATGEDKYEIVRTSLTILIGMLPFIMVWGCTMQTIAFFTSKTFDMSGSFNAVMQFYIGASTVICGGGFAIFMKKKTDADGSVSETSSITKE